KLPVPDISKLSKQQAISLEKALDRLGRRDIGNVLDEIESKDRQALDDIVFGIFGLSQKERKEVYSSLRALVTERTTKSKSVKTNGNGNGNGKRKKRKEAETNDFVHRQQTLFDFVL
ncbi:hypothetical protein J4441_03195, partial [Candidatus Micrarchaeota archaeon]|nr:hypothetical protein [Candidatus Micrarchaeota archaeon]